MYSISAYGRMITDRVRTDAYAQALREAVKPGAVVLDIGTGTGFFAMLACKFGARRVYAIEPDDAIQLAREMAAANGYADRIEFIQDYSTAVTLPELADVMISDLRGQLPLFQRHLPAIIDARRRLLKDGGVLIPKEDRLWVAVAEDSELFDKLSAPWLSNAYDLDMQVGWRIVSNTWRKGRVAPEQLLVEPRHWATLDYATVEDTDFATDISWDVRRRGTAHGIILWFDATLFKGLEISNAPGLPELIYGSSFFSLPAPVPLAEGDSISLKLKADLVGDNYIMRWETRVLEQGDPERIKASFKQSTFAGVPLSPKRLRKQAANFVPALGEEGQLDLFILTQMNGDTPLEEIARRAAERFPAKLKSRQEALTRVGDLSKRYSS
jgi:SAM-dependent methyltransferase